MSNKPFYVPRVETHLIHSRFVEQTYQVQVMQPLTRRNAQERFPVLYLTDGNAFFDMAKAIAHALHFAGQLKRFILVGIGYPGDNPFTGSLLRCRDLSPAHRGAYEGLPRSMPIEDVPEIEPGRKFWNGAPEFARFLRDELVQFIDTHYPTVVSDRAYAGHSMGAGFGLHVLFSQTDIFNRYILSSPGLTADGDDHAILEARRFISTGCALDAHVVMTVGDLEEYGAAGKRAQFVSSFYRLAALLKRAAIPGLRLDCRAIPGETHASVFPIAFSHGVQAVFGPGNAIL